MSFDAHKNFCKVLVSAGYNASATSIVLSAGGGAKLPAAPFNLTWFDSTLFDDPSDDPNVERVRVTAIASDTITITRGVDGTTAKTHNTADSQYEMVLAVGKAELESIESAIDLSSGGGPFASLSQYQQKTARPPFIQHQNPTPGNSVTLATITGAGIVDMIWVTMGAPSSDLAYNERLQVFTDGAVLPDIDVDLGTLFLNHLNGRQGDARSYATEHIHSSSMGDSGTGMSGALRYKIPYSNGIIVKLYSPPDGSSSSGDYSLFAKVDHHELDEAAVPSLRLRSNCTPWLQKKTYSASDIITFFDLVNAAGWLVWQSMVVQGANTSANKYSYLERVWFWAVDGEDTTPDGSGQVITDFSNTGGEDVFLSGWYFANCQKIFGQLYTMVTATNNNDGVTCAGFDFWNANGGLKFNSRLKVGWSLKSGNVVDAGHSMSWVKLFYIDTAVPFAPGPPSMTATPGDGQVTLAIKAPVSYGSSKITAYTGTYSPGSGTFSVAVGATSAVVTGLTNGTAYTFSLTATNSVGVSAAGTVVSTPTAAPSNPFPTITSATVLARYKADALTGFSDGDQIATWPKVTGFGSSSVSLVESFAGSGPVYKTGILNGKAVARYDSASFHRLVGDGSFNTAAPAMVLVCFKPSNTSVNQLFDTYPGTSGHGRCAGGINGSGNWAVYAGASDVESGVTPTTGAHVLAFMINGASSYVSVDGVKSSVGNAGSGGLDVFSMGAVSALNGDVAEYVCVAGNISDSDRRLIEAYLGAEYGVTVV